MEPKKVRYYPENIFSSNADTFVIPCSTNGTVSPSFLMGLNKWGVRIPELLPKHALGTVFELKEKFVIRYMTPTKPIRLLFACSVENESSNIEAIVNICRQVAEQSLVDDQLKEIAMPLFGTGAGRLNPKTVVENMDSILQQDGRPDCKFSIYINDSKTFKVLTSDDPVDPDYDKSILSSDLNYAVKNYRFFAVGSHWGDEDQYERFLKENIWESGRNNKYENIINNLRSADVLILKSSFQANGISYLRIRAIGWVTRNIDNELKVGVTWQKRDLQVDVPNLGNYRGTIARVKETQVRVLLEQLQKDNIDLSFITIGPPTTPDITHPQSTIATLVGDTDSKTDYLAIHQDVTAFAKVISAKRFRPPLAIALFGKWGSGKSFFMQRLIEQVDYFIKIPKQDYYCRGIVQIHFNAWSYLDANLWASIVTRIFDGLNQYIKNDSKANTLKEEIEKELSQKLVITYEEVAAFEAQLLAAENKIKTLQTERSTLKETLDKNIRKIETDTISKAIETVNSNFNMEDKIKAALLENPSVIATSDTLKQIIPEQYWDNPEEAYLHAKSIFTFLKEFFNKKYLLANLIFIVTLLLLVLFLPVFLTEVCNWLKKHDFSIPTFQTIVTAIIVVTPTLIRAKNTFKKLQPLFSVLWKVKTSYQFEIEKAKAEHEQREKAIRLAIEERRNEMITLDQRIQQIVGTVNDLEFKIKHALATEALYSFIEKRCKSDDYRKMLGIVSIVRNDFETLSKLFTAHTEESSAKNFLDKFERPLERIILYIDDLDRCPEERVVEVLEAVNLLMAFELFIVVVGVDPRWVKNALLKKYQFQFSGMLNDKTQTGIDTIDTADYLEKIFQVPFHLKPADDEDVKKMLNALITPHLEDSIDSEDNSFDDYKNEARKNQPSIGLSLTIGSSLSEPQIAKDFAKPFLELSKREVSLIEAMSVIIGANPRAVKRFVNSYQIIRAHEGFLYFKDQEDREFLVCMLLLALPTGKYRKLYKPFVKFLNEKSNQTKTFNNFIELSFPLENTDLQHLKNQLNATLSIRQIYNLLQGLPIPIFKKHHQFVQRFTFESRDEENWLD